MNSNYLYEYANEFERVLSTGYQYHYSTLTIEKLIARSSYFQKIEVDEYNGAPIIQDADLIKQIYPELNINLLELPIYNQCLWASEAYLRIQKESKLSFECIFLYIPLTKIYELFPLYHEMDFSHVVKLFNELYEKESAFSILLKKYKYSLKEIAERIGVPYDTLYSFKQRRRDIKKINIESALKLSNIFNVRIETIAEIRI